MSYQPYVCLVTHVANGKFFKHNNTYLLAGTPDEALFTSAPIQLDDTEGEGLQILASDPSPLEVGIWYNSTEQALKIYTGGELLSVPTSPPAGS